jgi:hypothetical protein
MVHVKKGKWQQRQRRAAEALLGTRITGWTAVEMAIVDVGPDGSPLFEVVGIDCLQLWRLELETADGLKAITAYQNNDLWGLQIDSAAQRSVHEVDGIFRRRRLSELPTGDVEAVTVRRAVPTLDVAEVELEVNGATVTLVAGEIEEHVSAQLSFRWLDESVLVFTDPYSPASISWTPPRARFVERRLPPVRTPPLPQLVEAALRSTTPRSDVEDEEAVRAFGRHIERLWRTHIDDVSGWPSGHTTDGNSVHVCYRAGDDLIEAFGVAWYDFGHDVFAYRARFRAVADGSVSVGLAVEPSPTSGGPRLHTGGPVVLAEQSEAGTKRRASLATPRARGELRWVDAVATTEHPAT